MSCIVLVGGIIGCGKTTLVNYFQENEVSIFGLKKVSNEESSTETKNKITCRIILDELCSIEEQANMMNAVKGWKNFRVDLLMAAEHFISSLCEPKFIILGPLTERSSLLLEKLKKMNESCTLAPNVFLVEDNFYYRSMRYDWFQLARRANIGFSEIFLECPLALAISRNSQRGYSIPEDTIKRTLHFMEYPEPEKYRWEKYSVIFNSANALEKSSLKEVIKVVEEATGNPAEMLIMADKIEAQAICAKNVMHQADIILRKLISKKVSFYQEKNQGADIKSFISNLIEIRHRLLHCIKQGSVCLPQQFLENFKTEGLKSMPREFENTVSDLFEEEWNKKSLSTEFLIKTD